MNHSRRFFRTVDGILIILLLFQIYNGSDRRYFSGLLQKTGCSSTAATESDSEEKASESGISHKEADDADAEENADTEQVLPVVIRYADAEELSADTAAAIEDFYEITVLITNPEDGGYFHSTLSFSFYSDVIFTDKTGRTLLKAGDTLKLSAADYENGDSVFLEPASDDAQTAVIALNLTAETGNEDVRSYAGYFEITRMDGAFLLKNTLPVEEYLRYVVPAEMPASYPAEALQAQAVCARTYALCSAMSLRFAAYGADISDDTSCQVYNTQGTDERSDAAVRATAGRYLVFEGKPAECYYFSTSCGVTTDAAIWGEDLPYLKSTPVGGFSGGITERETTEDPETDDPETGEDSDENDDPETDPLREEDAFRKFLDNGTYGIESEESWYRWEATFLLSDLTAQTEEEIGDIFAVEVTERGSGGIVTELTVFGSAGQKVIRSQYEIRSFFSLEGSAAGTKQDGTSMPSGMILPSAFFCILAEEDGRITLSGGGFGHGCGMSQNAAKAYALAGADANEILSFFYSGTKIYNAGE